MEFEQSRDGSEHGMDWDGAIEFQRKLLLREVLRLYERFDLEPGGAFSCLTWTVARLILFVLRPAESAFRRLVLIEARQLKVEYVPRTKRKASGKRRKTGMRGERVPPFRLFDKPIEERKEKKPPPPPQPRITVIETGMSPLEYHIHRQQQRLRPKPKRKPRPPRNAPPNTERMSRRLAALYFAMLDMPKQAKRMARALARREAMPEEERGPGPLRHDRPPGHRQRKKHPIDQVLRDCVALELKSWEREPIDSS